MTECFLSDQEIRKLNRDLRILIAANGTLTRGLNIVADDEVIVQIVKQRIHDVSPKLSEFEQLGQVGSAVFCSGTSYLKVGTRNTYL